MANKKLFTTFGFPLFSAPTQIDLKRTSSLLFEMAQHVPLRRDVKGGLISGVNITTRPNTTVELSH